LKNYQAACGQFHARFLYFQTLAVSFALTGLEIFLTINPGRRSRCSLALGYFLSALQAFNLREFVKFASKVFACLAWFAVHLIRPAAFIGFRRDKSGQLN
jgi:hypothetical protein